MTNNVQRGEMMSERLKKYRCQFVFKRSKSFLNSILFSYLMMMSNNVYTDSMIINTLSMNVYDDSRSKEQE